MGGDTIHGMQVRTGDADIFYEVRGDGPDVVLLHPFPSDHTFWNGVGERLESRYRLVLPDLRGHGQSTAGEGPATMHKHAQDIARVCDELRIAKAVFVGCSIGGYIMFEIWRRSRERVGALVFCDTKAPADNEEGRAQRLKAADDAMERGPEYVIGNMFPKLLGETTQRNRPDVVAAARATMNRTTAEGFAAIQRGMAERPDSTPTLATITVPTLALGGEEDRMSPPQELQRIAAGIPGASLKIIAKAGHLAPMEQPEEVGLALRQFLDTLPR